MKSISFRFFITTISALLLSAVVMTITVNANPADQANYALNDPYLQRLHMDSCYHIFGYSDNGDAVQLHDSSKWSVTPHKKSMVLEWRKSHEIFIKPAYSCVWPRRFITYNYVLYNRNKNEAVEVKLIASKTSPLPFGAATFRIEHIEPFQRIVQLSDNTYWRIDPNDPYFESWKQGDRILVGVNNKWRTAPYPQILINVDAAKQPYSPAIFHPY